MLSFRFLFGPTNIFYRGRTGVLNNFNHCCCQKKSVLVRARWEVFLAEKKRLVREWNPVSRGKIIFVGFSKYFSVKWISSRCANCYRERASRNNHLIWYSLWGWEGKMPVKVEGSTLRSHPVWVCAAPDFSATGSVSNPTSISVAQCRRSSLLSPLKCSWQVQLFSGLKGHRCENRIGDSKGRQWSHNGEVWPVLIALHWELKSFFVTVWLYRLRMKNKRLTIYCPKARWTHLCVGRKKWCRKNVSGRSPN